MSSLPRGDSVTEHECLKQYAHSFVTVRCLIWRLKGRIITFQMGERVCSERQWDTVGLCVCVHILALHSSHSLCAHCAPPVSEFSLPVATSAEIPRLDAQKWITAFEQQLRHDWHPLQVPGGFFLLFFLNSIQICSAAIPPLFKPAGHFLYWRRITHNGLLFILNHSYATNDFPRRLPPLMVQQKELVWQHLFAGAAIKQG